MASYLVPFFLCAVILPCTDADQMEDWKMKGATGKKEEGRKKKWSGEESQKGDRLEKMFCLVHDWKLRPVELWIGQKHTLLNKCMAPGAT